eukprot:TRINITY_DN6113_c1_g1_i1.p1 TRINITY_DN6113_c1_g1~~TRINITY_DN6113_c1_g1_i1.p1  ORF type:complete len:517 (-),score=52.35 TRINITY_DN6113_c1_g1_i1:218-1768(-)
MDAQYSARLHSPKKQISPVKIREGGNGNAASPAVGSAGDLSARRKLNYNVSPSKELFFDRTIPSMTAGNLEASFSILPVESPERAQPNDSSATAKALYKQVLQNELLGTANHIEEQFFSKPSPQYSKNGSTMTATGTEAPPSPTRLFSYKTKKTQLNDSPFSLSPISLHSQQLLSSPKKPQRKIPKVPFKVLEAPQIQDDFYLNLVDWSSQNLLAVGLGQSVYLWNASTSQVTRLCDVNADLVTSLSWMARGSHLAVGVSDGSVALWDVNKQKKIRTFMGHKARVGTMAWGQTQQWALTTGSRDRTILQRDVRSDMQYVSKLTSHKQEVCGLKWGYNPSYYLASGGNDNKLNIWDLRQIKEESSQPLYSYSSHKAAVKGLAWSPHQRGLLASGGGTADQCIRFWNTVTGQELNCIDTGSQVCCLAWSKNVNEIVSTHGYSQNQITVWSYPSLSQIATLTGHSMRVLYLAVSPDGQTVVTGAGDETLRFWSIFPKAKNASNGKDFASSLSSPFSDIR